MSEYGKIVAYIFNLCGNEFVTQLFLVALLFIPALKRRSLFWVRYPLSWAAVITLQHLLRLGIVLIPDALNYILVLALLMGITALCFKADIYQAMFVAVCIYCCQFIISNTAFTTVFVLMHLTKNGGNWMYYYIIMPVTMAVLMPLVYLFVVRRIKRSDLLFNSHTVIYIVLAFVLVATTLTCFARKEIFWSLVGQAYLLSISTLFTVSTMLAGFMNLHKRRLEEENVILHQLLHKDKQRYEQAALANEKIQIKYHDMKLHENNGIVDFESLREVEPDSEILRSMYFTGNSALDVILSEKAMMCERLGIRFVCTADGSLLNFVKAHHIYSLVGNALQNAIDSLKKEPDPANKQLDVNIVRHGDMCVIKTENYVSGTVEMDDEGLPVTQKKDKTNHGYGTRSICEVVRRYGGQLMFIQKDNIFTMVAMLPLPTSTQS